MARCLLDGLGHALPCADAVTYGAVGGPVRPEDRRARRRPGITALTTMVRVAAWAARCPMRVSGARSWPCDDGDVVVPPWTPTCPAAARWPLGPACHAGPAGAVPPAAPRGHPATAPASSSHSSSRRRGAARPRRGGRTTPAGRRPAHPHAPAAAAIGREHADPRDGDAPARPGHNACPRSSVRHSIPGRRAGPCGRCGGCREPRVRPCGHPVVREPVRGAGGGARRGREGGRAPGRPGSRSDTGCTDAEVRG